MFFSFIYLFIVNIFNVVDFLFQTDTAINSHFDFYHSGSLNLLPQFDTLISF